MDIASIIASHGDVDVTLDSVSALQHTLTHDITVVVDGLNASAFQKPSIQELLRAYASLELVTGFRHGLPKSPYRNVALSLKRSFERFPNHDWHVYSEYDVLFRTDQIVRSLETAARMDVSLLGFCGIAESADLSFAEAVSGVNITKPYYMLGCCMFFSRKFMEQLVSRNFFERFLFSTASFTDGSIPRYDGFDFSEHLYPSLARSLGGDVGVLSTWDGRRWHGSGKRYPVRWKPELTEVDDEASIVHPVKSYDNKIRKDARLGRNKRADDLCNT